MQDVIAVFQNTFEFFPDHRRIIGHGRGQLSFFHAFIKFCRRHMFFIAVYLFPKGIILRDDDGLKLFRVGNR